MIGKCRECMGEVGVGYSRLGVYGGGGCDRL